MDQTKCEISDGILAPCTALSDAMSDTYISGRKGVTLLEVWNMETMEITRTGAVLRSGNLGKNGVLMNYCPFCGASIGDHFKAKEEA